MPETTPETIPARTIAARNARPDVREGGWPAGRPRLHRPPRRSTRHTVLIVDDDPDVADSAKEVLERFVPGCRVQVAQSSATGLALMARTPVDVAIVDYMMPGRNGLEFMRRARELEPGLPVILMTGYGSVDVAARAINEHQVDGFLTKPFDAVVLAETVQKTLARHAPAQAPAEPGPAE